MRYGRLLVFLAALQFAGAVTPLLRAHNAPMPMPRTPAPMVALDPPWPIPPGKLLLALDPPWPIPPGKLQLALDPPWPIPPGKLQLALDPPWPIPPTAR
jgi:hypothetical protein